MRVAMVTTFYPPYSFGGDATYVKALARGLVARGHEVAVIHCGDAFNLLNGGPPPEDEPGEDGVTVTRMHSRFGAMSPLLTHQTGRPFLKARQIRTFLDRGGFDLVHFHNISLIGGPAVLPLARRCLSFYTLHEHWAICATHVLWKNKTHACTRPTCLSCSIVSGTPPQLWRYGGLLRTSLDSIDCLISPSEYTAKRHRRAGVEKPIEVLPLFSALSGSPDPAPAVRSHFLFVGRVVTSKGLGPLLEVFSKAPHLKLLIVGDGPQAAELRRRYERLRNIEWVGSVPQDALKDFYRTAVAVIMPSIAPETFGLVVVEASAFCVPAVVRESAGASVEIVRGTGGGFVYRNEQELAACLDRLCHDPPARDALGRRARAGYEREYTLDVHLDRYEALASRFAGLRGRKAREAHPQKGPWVQEVEHAVPPMDR